MDGYVEPVYRHLKKGHSRGAVGVDLLTVIDSHVDEAGNTCLIVIICVGYACEGVHRPYCRVGIVHILLYIWNVR